MDGRDKGFSALLVLMVLLSGSNSVSAASPAKLVSGLISNALSAILKLLWSMTSTPKTVLSGRPMMKFESGYTVETVFDGSKLGIEPFSVEVLPGGELLILDFVNSNIYRISLPLSRYSRPKLVVGSAEGFTGHIDGRPREARMNHPKGFTVDDRGNIYVADSLNMAIRKVSDTGVTTIAGGKWNKGGHMDGPSEHAKFSNDFEVVYVGSSCSLLVVDRGNKAIREIQLHFDDCAYQYENSFPLGLAVLFAAAFFGYMLALLQRRVGVMVASKDATALKTSIPPLQKPVWASGRPPLVSNDSVSKKQDEEEGFLTSIVKLLSGAKSSLAEIVWTLFSRKTQDSQHQVAYQQQQLPNSWPIQDSFIIPEEDEPPPVEAKTPAPRKTYAFMSKNQAKIHQLRQGQAYFNHWNGKMQQHQSQNQQQVHQHQQYSLGPQTYFERSCEATNEILFGAVQELDQNRSPVEINAVHYGDLDDLYGLRSRLGYNTYYDSYY